jgi:hypothetical protein
MLAASTISGVTELVSADVSYFDTSAGHYYILGLAVFSIFWGLINVMLVSQQLTVRSKA